MKKGFGQFKLTGFKWYNKDKHCRGRLELVYGERCGNWY